MMWVLHTVCSRRSDPFYIVTYYIKWVTSLTHSIYDLFSRTVFRALFSEITQTDHLYTNYLLEMD